MLILSSFLSASSLDTFICSWLDSFWNGLRTELTCKTERDNILRGWDWQEKPIKVKNCYGDFHNEFHMGRAAHFTSTCTDIASYGTKWNHFQRRLTNNFIFALLHTVLNIQKWKLRLFKVKLWWSKCKWGEKRFHHIMWNT